MSNGVLVFRPRSRRGLIDGVEFINFVIAIGLVAGSWRFVVALLAS